MIQELKLFDGYEASRVPQVPRPIKTKRPNIPRTSSQDVFLFFMVIAIVSAVVTLIVIWN
jgi:hypothetical protein